MTGRFASDRGLVATGSGHAACKVDRTDALAHVGYAGQRLDEALEERFADVASRCDRLGEAAYIWRIEEIDRSRALGELAPQVALSASGLVLTGADIVRHLSGARLVAIFAATLGQACERELKRLAATNPLDYLLFDCCTSSLAEAAAQAVQEVLGEEARKLGLVAHARFSPGYGDLSLDVQPMFLAALDATRRLGLTTTSRNFLLPTKSVTAVVGLFDGEAEDGSSDPCDLCAARTYCCYRERGTTCRERHGG